MERAHARDGRSGSARCSGSSPRRRRAASTPPPSSTQGQWQGFELMVVRAVLTDAAVPGSEPPIDAGREIAAIGGRTRSALTDTAWWGSVARATGRRRAPHPGHVDRNDHRTPRSPAAGHGRRPRRLDAMEHGSQRRAAGGVGLGALRHRSAGRHRSGAFRVHGGAAAAPSITCRGPGARAGDGAGTARPVGRRPERWRH